MRVRRDEHAEIADNLEIIRSRLVGLKYENMADFRNDFLSACEKVRGGRRKHAYIA